MFWIYWTAGQVSILGGGLCSSIYCFFFSLCYCTLVFKMWSTVKHKSTTHFHISTQFDKVASLGGGNYNRIATVVLLFIFEKRWTASTDSIIPTSEHAGNAVLNGRKVKTQRWHTRTLAHTKIQKVLLMWGNEKSCRQNNVSGHPESCCWTRK